MPLKIVRNDITRMNTQAIVNTANEYVNVGTGCDIAVYMAAGYDELLNYRKEKIGRVPEGEAFITPGFDLQAEYIIHAVSPAFKGGNAGEEDLLRSCYRKSLSIAKEYGIRSIAFPLISTGSFGYPKEEGMRIAVDEINTFLLRNDMLIYLVVFDSKAAVLGEKLYPDLEAYIDQKYVQNREEEEYAPSTGELYEPTSQRSRSWRDALLRRDHGSDSGGSASFSELHNMPMMAPLPPSASTVMDNSACERPAPEDDETEPAEYSDFISLHESKLQERMHHLSDTFSQYLMYLIQSKNMENKDVYKKAIVDKKTFSKIKNNPNYHPQKLTALCLCIGAKLNMDETKDLLARAGYALSPCDKTDIIFTYFIENKIYDMIELDIQLEEHGLPCIIT